ncbi:MAG: hypothetical protein DRR19_12370 [Candidatus Parabeggiatoa sp. nov. 1]|nr:MAG: hypothetical protein DRR19_12370 [Gammaproteobacteria bacterium]
MLIGGCICFFIFGACAFDPICKKYLKFRSLCKEFPKPWLGHRQIVKLESFFVENIDVQRQ